jgi:hypothetical protein
VVLLGLGLAVGLLAEIPGCDEPPASDAREDAAPPPPRPVALAGTLTGRITWSGELPRVPPYRSLFNPLSDPCDAPQRLWPNPHAPDIDPDSRGVRNAVVFLRGIRPEAAPAWNHPPVQVEVRDHQLHVVQGKAARRTGFVHSGDRIEIVSRQAAFASLQARGACFFGLPLPDRDRVHKRRLNHTGVVELLSGAGHFWMRGWLFVLDHPLVAHPDEQGRFTLNGVPPGEYDLVCWLPDWREASREWDGDTARLWRLTFRPAREQVRQVRVQANEVCETSFVWTAEP